MSRNLSRSVILAFLATSALALLGCTTIHTSPEESYYIDEPVYSYHEPRPVYYEPMVIPGYRDSRGDWIPLD